jgi:hypothetical protein
MGYDMHDVLDGLLDEESFFEVKPLFAPEMLTGFGLLEGRPVGIVANNPMHKGGVIFTDSADKAARFIWLCDAFGVPLVFLADVPGFMIGTHVEREGKKFSNVAGVSALPKGLTSPAATKPPVIFRVDEPDEAIFAAFSDRLKDTIRQSQEWRDKQEGAATIGNDAPPPGDDDVPF